MRKRLQHQQEDVLSFLWGHQQLLQRLLQRKARALVAAQPLPAAVHGLQLPLLGSASRPLMLSGQAKPVSLDGGPCLRHMESSRSLVGHLMCLTDGQQQLGCITTFTMHLRRSLTRGYAVPRCFLTCLMEVAHQLLKLTSKPLDCVPLP